MLKTFISIELRVLHPCDVRLSQKMFNQATESYLAHLMSLTFTYFRSGRALEFFRTVLEIQYMVCGLRSHSPFSPITTFHLSAHIVTVPVRGILLIRRSRCAVCAMGSVHQVVHDMVGQ